MTKLKHILVTLILLFSCMTAIAQSSMSKFVEAKDLFENKDYAHAAELFQSVAGSDDVDNVITSTSSYYAALCMLNMNQIQGAISEFEYFIDEYEFSSFRDDALFKLGSLYFELGQHRNCRNTFVELINTYPESEYYGSAYYWIGKSYSEENRFAEAEEFLTQAISNRSDNNFVDYSLYALANLYEETNQYESAVTYYDELLAYYRSSELAPYAQLRIGASYFKLKEYDKAILELSDPLINQLPQEEYNEANYLLASSFFRLKEYENAAATYRKLLSNSPDENVAREVEYGLAFISFQMRSYGEAFKTFDQLSKSHSDSITVNSLYWKAEAKRYLGDYDAAGKYYSEFLNKYPNHKLAGSVKFNLGILEFNRKKYANAERHLIEATTSSEKEVQAKAFTLLGEISLQKKDFQSAEMYFQNAVKISLLMEDIAQAAILGLGVTQYFLGKYDDAVLNLTDLSVRHQRFQKSKVNFFLAESYFAKKSYNDAIKHYHRVEDDNPELTRQALYGKSYSYFNLKDFPNSVFYFKEYLSKYPNGKNILDAKLRLADSYYGIKEFDKASKIYAEVFSTDLRELNNDYAYYQYAQALFKAGKSSDAVRRFDELQTKFRNSRYADDAQYLIGWIYFQQNDFSKAIENYQEIFNRYSRSPLIPIAIYSIGDCYYNLGEYDSALESYLLLIERYPNTQFVFDAVNGIQYCYIALDQPEKAIDVIDNYVAANPNSEYGDDILMKKGEIYYTLGQYEKAQSGYTDFLEKYPNSAYASEAYYWLGKSASNLDQNDEAMGYFQIVVDRYIKSKYSVDAVIELGKILVEKGNYRAALDLYNRATGSINEQKRIPEIMFEKALAQVKLEDTQSAYETFFEIINYYNGTIFSAKSKIELGLLEIKRENYENAETYFRDLGENRLDDIGAHAQFLYGLSLFEQKKYNEAISAFVRVRSVFSTYDLWYTRSLIMLGDCYAKLNDKKNAREMYRAVISKHSRDELGAEARRKLNAL